jgi:very-short-patch-repair endonuclease
MGEELHKGAPPINMFYGRENRKKSTEAESVLWTYLRGRKLHGFKFRHQHPISDFVADFYCHESKLIVEIDGNYHNSIEQMQYDKGRTYELNELKIKVIRFSNWEVLNKIEFVLGEITAQLNR